jgi:hypothetical protein
MALFCIELVFTSNFEYGTVGRAAYMYATFKKSSFFAYYFLKVRLHHFSKIKILKEVSKQ